ncbi:DUF4192 family protein [Sinomonas sp. JGH33]|uniref:DUF4192 family protein n=1 Tax=Sinomonas terricola TaxID=3110330 RepID=A0ABU5TBA9_9MICC|nr:DUF4192 family protein [Sinomonas sp. JGH33]MEA5456925.1 DUF4192 family protein [Sinomonas sp. JGH33]
MTTTALTLPDMLAAIEHGLGFTPEDSLVAASVRGDDTLGVYIRLDAAPILQDPERGAHWAVGHVRTDTKLEGIIAAVYTHAPAEDAERLLRAVAAEAERLGLTVYLAFRVHADGWTELRHRAAGTREQVTDSALYAELVYRGSAVYGKEPDDVPFAGPEDTPARIDAAPIDTPDEAAAWWTMLLDSGREPSEGEAWQILADLGDPSARDLMIAATAGDLTARAGTGAADERVCRLLLGHAAIRPDWERVERAERVLTRVLAHAPAGHRAGALTLLGWIAWYKGMNSAAHVWLTRAEQDSPGYRLAALLARLIGMHVIPDVAKDPATAYHRNR